MDVSAAARWRLRCKDIALDMDDARFLEVPEFRELHGIVLPGERALAITSGEMHAATSLIALTDQRIIMLASSLMLAGDCAVPVLDMETIDLNKLAGHLAGRRGITCGSIVVDCGKRTWRFWGIPNVTVTRFLQRLEQATEALKSGLVQESRAQKSNRSRIEVLDTLRGQGLLTDDEFFELQKLHQLP